MSEANTHKTVVNALNLFLESFKIDGKTLLELAPEIDGIEPV